MSNVYSDRMCKLRCFVRNYGRERIVDLVLITIFFLQFNDFFDTMKALEDEGEELYIGMLHNRLLRKA